MKKEKDKKRVMSLKWSFSSDNYEYQNQLSMVNNIILIFHSFTGNSNKNIAELFDQQIKKHLLNIQKQHEIVQSKDVLQLTKKNGTQTI